MTPVTPEAEPRIHDLKTLPEFFEAMASGVKTFEVRVNDRDYRVGDVLRLMEYDPSIDPQDADSPRRMTGRTLERTVVYVLEGPLWGIRDGCVAMAVREALS